MSGFLKGLLAAILSGIVTAVAEYLQHATVDPGHVPNAAAVGAALGLVAYLFPAPGQQARIAQLLNRIELLKMGVGGTPVEGESKGVKGSNLPA